MSAGPAQAGRARFDIGDIVRVHRARLESEHRLTPEQKRVLTDIAQCRTAALGGHVDRAPSCGYEHPSYNSCRNRHCPKCQALAQENWIEQRSERLLDVGHFHVVFTLPSRAPFPRAARAARGLRRALHAAAETLLELGESRLGATLGATLVLHTWTRELRFHPARARDRHRRRPRRSTARASVASDRRYLFPVKVMGTCSAGKILALR